MVQEKQATAQGLGQKDAAIVAVVVRPQQGRAAIKEIGEVAANVVVCAGDLGCGHHAHWQTGAFAKPIVILLQGAQTARELEAQPLLKARELALTRRGVELHAE